MTMHQGTARITSRKAQQGSPAVFKWMHANFGFWSLPVKFVTREPG